ncbi:hypothetical protein ATK36_2265 [Amycolatopsis sulphurea]|uniref:Uncharacterized protein n=1 Tax=Amycolatopsis sulphurea TaxID=76022 RepID=A0A2A9F9L5_9PSEU|nr:hypothetical protein ATK36_2265 [Amycolatopsis sulphurea]
MVLLCPKLFMVATSVWSPFMVVMPRSCPSLPVTLR